MRVDRLQRYGAWFALATSVLLLAGIADVVIVALFGGFTNVMNFGPAPAWVGPPMVLAFVVFVLSVVTSSIVAAALAWTNRRSRRALVYAAIIGAGVATVALVTLLAAQSLLGADGLGVASTVAAAGYGTYLILINVAGFLAGTLGQVVPWLGVASGASFLIAAVFGLNGWAMVFPAIALYIVWSAWLGVRLWHWVPAELGAVPC